MRLAFCLFKYFPYGGLQRDLLDLALFRARAGDEVFIYTMEWQGERPAPLRIRLVPARGLTNHGRCRSYHRQLAGLMAQDGIELSIGFNRMPGLDIYFGSDLSYLARRHGWLRRCTRRYRLFVAFERAVFSPASQTHILALTEAQKREYQAQWRTPDGRFTVLPPGISPLARAPAAAGARAARQRLRAGFGVDDSQILLLLIASAFKTKGLDRALLAMQALPPALRARAQLLVVGQDKARPWQRLAQRLGLERQVQFAGGQDRIPAIMQAGDLLLHPAYKESSGKTILESVVAGLPIIVTSVCGFAYHVDRAGAGVVLPAPFEQRFFNRQLAAAMADAGQRAAWRQSGIRYGRRQDLYSMTRAASEAIDQLHPPPPPPPRKIRAAAEGARHDLDRP